MDARTPKWGSSDLGAWGLDGDSRLPREAEIVSATEANRMLAEGARAVDIRAADAFSQGHIPGAVNRPLDQLLAAASQDLGPVIVYCETGGDARQHSGLLRKVFGAENFFVLAHGFGEWRDAGLPVAVGA